jgi:hypothetical protein
MKFRKGQGSTEYLVILGAVLLVALVIVSLLGWFPALGGSTREQQSRSYWQGATPFSITAVFMNTTGAILSVASRSGEKLQLTNLTFGDSLGTYVVYNTSTSFSAGEEKTLSSFSVTNLNFNTTRGNQCSSTGTPFDYSDVVFTYTQGSITGIKQTGARPLVGRCS